MSRMLDNSNYCNHVVRNDSPIKIKHREEIEVAMQSFLKRGGEIKVETDVHSYTPICLRKKQIFRTKKNPTDGVK